MSREFEQEQTGDSQLTPQQRIERLLRLSPSGPDFTQPTVRYSEESIEASLNHIRDVLSRQYSESAPEVNQKVSGILSNRHYSLPRSDLVAEEGRVLITFANGKHLPANHIVTSLFHANPDLGIRQYLTPTYPPLPQAESIQRCLWFNSRFIKIQQTGNFPDTSPVTKIIAVAFIAQVAKNLATNRSRDFLKRANFFSGITNQDQISAYLDSLGHAVEQIRKDGHYIGACQATIRQIAETADINEAGVQLLLDLAFIRNGAFDQDAEFKQAIEPLIGLVAEGRWEEAFQHRDFLLKYFGASFPDWRIQEYQAQAGTVSLESFKQMAKAVVDHKLTITEDEVPPEYKKSFGDIFPRKVERAQKERNIEIIRNSLEFSNEILRALKTVHLNWTAIDRAHVDKFFHLSSRFRYLENVELWGNIQHYWYKTFSAVETKNRWGNSTFGYRNHANFGKLLYDVILTTSNPTGNPLLQLDQIRNLLITAHENSVNVHNHFTLAEYLKALIHSYHFDGGLSEYDPVIQFIDQLNH